MRRIRLPNISNVRTPSPGRVALALNTAGQLVLKDPSGHVHVLEAVEEFANGLVLHAPAGSKHRVGVTDTGNLNTDPEN